LHMKILELEKYAFSQMHLQVSVSGNPLLKNDNYLKKK